MFGHGTEKGYVWDTLKRSFLKSKVQRNTRWQVLVNLLNTVASFVQPMARVQSPLL
ncbi:hypothetical protein LINPERHAP1_LOCUS30377 [Linum perenne]